MCRYLTPLFSAAVHHNIIKWMIIHHRKSEGSTTSPPETLHNTNNRCLLVLSYPLFLARGAVCEHKTWRLWEAMAMPSAPLISLRVVRSENRKRDCSSNSASLLGKLLVLLTLWGFSLFLFPATVDSHLHKPLCYCLWQIVKTKIQNHTA